MIITHKDSYKAGWMLGDFEPTAYRTNQFEFAHHFYKKGFKGLNHKHDKATEFNYIVNGKVNINGHVLNDGYMFIFTKGEYCGKIEYLKDTNLIIIKSPSIVNDKYDADNKSMEMPK